RPAFIQFDPAQRAGRLPLHDRYTTLHLTYVHRNGEMVPPNAFTQEYGSFALGMTRLATVLRGGAARDMRRRRVVSTDDLFNLAPWNSDLCLVTNDAMLIYSAPPPDLEHLPDPEGFSRDEFWRGVARGVEWLATLRTEWQLVERQSTEMLAGISGLTARVNDGLLDEDDRLRLRLLAQGVSHAFNILPDLRYALVPSSISHATDVVLIFSQVQEQLGVEKIAAHVNTSIEELSAFLGYYSGTQLEYETREREQAENRTGLTISVMLILLSLISVPSLIKDASEIDWTLVASEPPEQLLAVIVLALLPILLLAVTTWFVLRRSRRG
ncbi:MAG: hypothetical protein JW910_08490, partial [Anaerolineae bacterium]|nr:hypothetical protein [Anaerolineae bacterium]